MGRFVPFAAVGSSKLYQHTLHETKVGEKTVFNYYNVHIGVESTIEQIFGNTFLQAFMYNAL